MLRWLVQQHRPKVDWHELHLDQDQYWNHSEMEKTKNSLLVKQNWKIKMKYSSLLLFPKWKRDMETKYVLSTTYKRTTILNMIFH